MIDEIRTELRFAWRSLVIPIALLLCALIAVSNVANASAAVFGSFSSLQRTHAEYVENHMDWGAALAAADHVVRTGGIQSASNPARYDYDAFVTSVAQLSPASSVSETLKYLGFIVFPLLFFLLGLWLVTGQRRYRLDKVAFVRAGVSRAVAAKQVTLVLIAALCVATTLLVDVVARAALSARAASALPLSHYPPLAPPAAHDPLAQWGVAVLAIVFFGAAGIAIGSFAGVFAVPAVAFLAYDFVFPILTVHDPRNWFQVLGYAVFDYSGPNFHLAEPQPIAVTSALGLAIASSVVLVGLGYVGSRIRNPRAT